MTVKSARKAWQERWSKPKEDEMPGEITCLCCRKDFMSPHTVNIRICGDCKQSEVWKSARGSLE